jgi:hypothetical protein
MAVNRKGIVLAGRPGACLYPVILSAKKVGQ